MLLMTPHLRLRPLVCWELCAGFQPRQAIALLLEMFCRMGSMHSPGRTLAADGLTAANHIVGWHGVTKMISLVQSVINPVVPSGDLVKEWYGLSVLNTGAVVFGDRVYVYYRGPL